MMTRGHQRLFASLRRDGMLFLLPVVLSIPFAATPLGRDQGYFAYGGWRMLHGELPYRDFWTNTFPGVFWWYMLMEVVSFIPRAMWNGAVIGLTSVLLSRGGAGRGGLLAGFGYGLLCPLLHRFWDMGQAEHLVNLFVAAGVQAVRPFRRGMLLGAAILCKPVALLFTPLLVWRPGLRPTDACRRIGLITLGAALPLAAWLALYAVGGGLGRVWEDLVVFNAGYGAFSWNAELVGRAVGGAVRWGASLWPAAVVAGVALARSRASAGLWLACALSAVVLQAKLFTYHWVVALAPLTALCGQGIADLRGMGWTLRCAVIVLAMGPWLASPRRVAETWYPAAVETWRGIRRVGGALSLEAYIAGFGDKERGADFSASDQQRAADEIVKRGCGNALVWGFEPGLNYLARTPNPMRYVADFPLTFPTASARQATVRGRHRARFIRELVTKRPGCVVVVRGDANPVEAQDSNSQMREFAEFAAVLAREYRGPVSVGSYDLWEAR